MEILTVEKELQDQALTLRDQATAIQVRTQENYIEAAELGKNMKALRAKVVDYFAPLKEAAYKAHKAVTAKEASELKPIDEAIDILKKGMNAFAQEQERKRQEIEAKLRREAEEQARKETERLLAAAAKAEAKGKAEKAEELLEKAENVYAAPVAVEPLIPKTVAVNGGNVTQAKDTEVIVTNMLAFLQGICNKGIAPTMVVVAPGALKSWVKANGLTSFPGLAIKQVSNARF